MRRFAVVFAMLTTCLGLEGRAYSQPPEMTPHLKSQVEIALFTEIRHIELAPPSITTPMPEANLMLQAMPEPIGDPRIELLTQYFETAMKSWVKPDAFSVDYHAVASDVATVIVGEDPIWDGDKSRARTGIMLLGIAMWESRYRAYVDDGTCNKYASVKGPLPKEIKVLLQKGNCDGGWAYSMWQVHPVRWNAGNGRIEDWTREVLMDRKAAIHAALAIARRSIRGSGGLCWYTGEPGGDEGCPKAEVRFKTGLEYYRDHSFRRFKPKVSSAASSG